MNKIIITIISLIIFPTFSSGQVESLQDLINTAIGVSPKIKMLEMKNPVLYYENTEGGHSAAADNKQRAYMQSLELAYLWEKLR